MPSVDSLILPGFLFLGALTFLGLLASARRAAVKEAESKMPFSIPSGPIDPPEVA